MDINASVSNSLDLLMPSIRQQLEVGRRPVVLGLTGLQGAGKSTWASAIVHELCYRYKMRAIQVSLDDFYYPHETLVGIRTTNPDNALLRTRGEPGTHDEQLAQSFFDDIQESEGFINIPVFDKSAFNGEGDRLPKPQWPRYQSPIDVVVFEGWCVGFMPLPSQEIQQRRNRAAEDMGSKSAKPRMTTLPLHSHCHLEQLNASLSRYCDAFMGPQHFDVLIQLDTGCLENVYRWRLEQEHAVIARGGDGMTDSEVADFIQGYMPAYELYLGGLREGFFKNENAKRGIAKPQLRVLLGPNREIVDMSLVI